MTALSIQPNPAELDNDAPPADQTEAAAASEETPGPIDLAEATEAQVNSLTQELRDTKRDLSSARQTIDALERREKIADRLRQAGAIDLEVARLLTEVAIADMDEPDVRLAVDDLRRHKPYLFTDRSGSLGGRTMGPRLAEAGPGDAAAHRAGQTGDRRDLMDYLRLRRRA